VYVNCATQLNFNNGIAGNNSQNGISLVNCAQCVVSGYELIANNTSNSAGIGDILISGGSYNRIIGNVSNMANGTSVSLLETNATNNNVISQNTLFQGATIIGAGTQIGFNQGFFQSAGWGTPTGAAVQSNYSGATATLAQTSAAVAEIIAALKLTGLFGS
jgi:hypothetical protein